MMKNKILDILKKNGGFVSGEELSNILGISRSAVWKHINNLKKDGYAVTAVTNKGYRLDESDVLSAEEVKNNLNTEIIGRNIIYTETVDSTNSLAKQRNDEADGTVFLTDIQTAGRGRRGKAWKSADKNGLWMTILLKPDISPQLISCLTLVAGLAVQRALTDICGVGFEIKWPNDLVLNKKKVCGILCEMSCEVEKIDYAVCGIGINLNNEEFDNEIKNIATSVFIEKGKKVKRCDAAAAVIENFEKLYMRFIKDGIENITEEYKEVCATLGKDVVIVKNGKEERAKALDITSSGELVIESYGKRKIISSGEVSVRGLFGYV
ncbi:MAG: biotin--[acetyl-CoA-carboxylase] ligase [Clostridia bacterium]|nr:biotin--[acetyl-CoA-carboxylase] ligase [Clostridia bacterium]